MVFVGIALSVVGTLTAVALRFFPCQGAHRIVGWLKKPRSPRRLWSTPIERYSEYDGTEYLLQLAPERFGSIANPAAKGPPVELPASTR